MKPFRLGLTGSIGMGKSTTAQIFAELGIAVWDADAAVHRLYAKGGAAVAPVSALVPVALENGAISRGVLKDAIRKNPSLLAVLETIVHPLVAADRDQFLSTAQGEILLLDIPLLFEKGTEAMMDATLLVTAPAALQRARVLARPGMTEAQFATILARQMPDPEKRARATHIIETLSLASTRAGVQALIAYIQESRDA